MQNSPKTESFICRETIAQHYIRGHGLEIGALHRPLAVPVGSKVSYVDFASHDVLVKRYPDLSCITPPDIITDGEFLTGIENNSFDFIIANHFFEHTENPLGTLKRFTEVLRKGGIIFMAIPDKRWTFDVDRDLTPFVHIVSDFSDGPDGSLDGHYDEWTRKVDKLTGPAFEDQKAAYLRERFNIHFHVWTIDGMAEMFSRAKTEIGIPVEIKFAFADPPMLEVVWVLEVQK